MDERRAKVRWQILLLNQSFQLIELMEKEYQVRRFPLLAAVASVCLLGALAVGSSSALATVWCKNKPANHICEAANRYPVGTVLQAELAPGTKAEFKGFQACYKSKLTLTLYETGSALITGWSFSECAYETPVVAEKVWHVEPYGDVFGGGRTSWLSETDSGMQSFNSPQTSVFVGLEEWYPLGKAPHCTYNFYASKVIGGASPQINFPELDANNLQKGWEENCPQKVSLLATYNITTPTPVYIEKQ